MTVRVPLRGLEAGARDLDGASSRYLCGVLRLGEGDRFVAFDSHARIEAEGVVVAASPAAARVTLSAPRAAAVVATRGLSLVYGHAKGDKVDAVVRDATELGATRIVIARTTRSVPRADAPEKKRDRWRRVADEAARQCGRGDAPVVDGIVSWPEALAAVEADARFCLDPRAETALGDALVPAAASEASIAFAVGPEGGLTPEEVATASAAGFLPVSLGPFVLRTETVAAAVLGAVRVLGR